MTCFYLLYEGTLIFCFIFATGMNFKEFVFKNIVFLMYRGTEECNHSFHSKAAIIKQSKSDMYTFLFIHNETLSKML